MRKIRAGLVSLATASAVVLATAASMGSHGPLIAAAFATLAIAVTALVLIGPEGLGMAILALCFFTAPFFRLFQLSSSSAISAIDPMLMAAIVLLLPRIAQSRPKISLLFLGSAFSVILIGYAAAIASNAASATAFEVTQWLFLILVLPYVFISLELSDREITRFAIFYIAGQMLSSAVALANGPDPVNQRYQGLATHPNYFADGAMMAIALLLHLYHHPRAKTLLNRWLWWGATVICLVGIYFSGARGPALGLAAILVLVPIVERSSLTAVFSTLGVALVALFLQPLTSGAAQGTTLARFTGSDATGGATSNFRLSEWQEAWTQIQHSPIFGNGLSIQVLTFHNNYLEIAAGIGLFGLAAYLIMIWSLTRGLFGPSAERRLLYPMVAFAVYGLTQPGFKDRSNWLPMLLGIAVFHGYRVAQRARGTDSGPDSVSEVATPPAVASN